MLLPLTESLYVSGTLETVDSVLLEVGTGYYVEVRTAMVLLAPAGNASGVVHECDRVEVLPPTSERTPGGRAVRETKGVAEFARCIRLSLSLQPHPQGVSSLNFSSMSLLANATCAHHLWLAVHAAGCGWRCGLLQEKIEQLAQVICRGSLLGCVPHPACLCEWYRWQQFEPT